VSQASHVVVARVLRLLDAISEAFTTSDWARLRSLYHDDARIWSVAGGDRVLSADELIDVLSRTEGWSYSTDGARTEALDENAVVVLGIARQRIEAEAVFISSAWLLTFRDGLVWRSRAYRSLAEARTAYDELGVDLGLL
jgi:ketosteroid isomerase-like protein